MYFCKNKRIIMSKYCAIIVAGGEGTRFGSYPKQFARLSGKPLIYYSAKAFRDFSNKIKIIVSLNKKYYSLWEELVEQFPEFEDIIVVDGGATRFESVKNALKYIENEQFVAIHDAARPMITADFIEECFKYAKKHGSAIPAMAPTDSVRIVSGDNSKILKRGDLRLIQTPQVFQSNILIESYETDYLEIFTDDASVVEYAGSKVSICEGLQNNIKITFPDDLDFAEFLLNKKTR